MALWNYTVLFTVDLTSYVSQWDSKIIIWPLHTLYTFQNIPFLKSFIISPLYLLFNHFANVNILILYFTLLD